ncbi:multidrug efflux system subunit MdtC [Planctomycetes bacterium CA13]|uniref:Multidrug efflux system subunit MdtC n=1 Tax=Novipirellula herctigrandis TaxID=2527986 RepID=A0A5C5ZEA5_9BACT|nr:multidrug efflux system subunit MdtC [Planctomycetes bacterium CA13]
MRSLFDSRRGGSKFSWLGIWRDRLPDLAIRWRFHTLVVTLAITLVSAYCASGVRFDSSVEVWFLDGDPQIELYHDFRDRFGKEQFIVVGLFPEDVFASQFLDQLDKFTDEIATLPLAHRAMSITNAEILVNEGGRLNGVRLAQTSSGQLPQTAEEIDEFRTRALRSRFVVGSLLAKDGSATSVVIMPSEEAIDVDREIELVKQVRAIVQRQFPSSVDYGLAGTPAINDAIFRAARRDFLLVTPIAALVVALFCFILFRTWIAAFVPLIIVGVTAVWVLGLMGLLGWRMTFLTSALVLVIMVIGVADSIHLVSAWQGERRLGRSARVAIRKSLYKLLPPCLFTTLTTMVGFLAMAACDMAPVRQFGILAAVGAVIALVLTILLTPCLLLLASASTATAIHSHGETRADRILLWLGRPTRRLSQGALAAAAILMLVTAVLIPSIRVSANPMTFFRPNAPVRKDMERIDEVFGGSASLEAVIRTPKGGQLKWENLSKLGKFQRWHEQFPAVGQTLSLVDLVGEIHRVQPFRPNREGTPRGVATALRAVERRDPELLHRLVLDDYSLGRMSIRVRLSEADSLAAQAELADAYIREHFNTPEISVQYTGHVKLYDDMRKYIVDAQIRSLTLAAVMITILMCVLLRSWKLGLFSMIPNVLPIFCGLALMSVLEIRLDPGTVMIASVALGLVVDDTCHFLVSVRSHMSGGETLEQAIEKSMSSAGRAIIATSLILASGFSVLVFGSFAPSMYFGVITAAVIVIALVADLVVLPAALLIFRRTSQAK